MSTNTQDVISKQYEKIEQLNKGDVEVLVEWIRNQSHLPSASEQLLMQIFCSCNFDIEATKKCIEYYYTIRTSFTGVFADRDPQLPKIQRLLRSLVCETFPNLTKDGYGVIYSKLLTPSLDDYDYLIANKLFDMRLHVWLREMGCVKGLHVIIDMDNSTLRHVQKMGYFNVRKMLGYLVEGLPIRIKGIHFVHPTNFIDYCFKLLYPLISEELRAMLHVHHGDEVFDYLPRNCVPDELNGTGGSIESLHESFIKAINDNREYFLQDENDKADESKRIKQGFFQKIGW